MGRQGRVFLWGGLTSTKSLSKARFQDRPRSSQPTPELNGGEKELESTEGEEEGKEVGKRLNEHEWRRGGFGRVGGGVNMIKILKFSQN